MRFGVNTFLWSANFGTRELDLLPAIRAHGFDGVEVTLVRPEEFEAAALREALARNGLACTVCSVLPRELSAISEDGAVRAKTRAHLAECVRMTAEVGSALLSGPLYAPVGLFTGGRRTADEWQRAVAMFASLEEELERHGVTLALEPLNRFETYFLNTTADAVRLCEEVGSARVGILWDTFHANIEEKDAAAALLACGKHLKHVHTSENDRGTPGSGHVDWSGVFAALRQLKYDNWLTIESFGFAKGDLSAAASIWRDLAPSADSIAWDGLKFLKAHN